MIYLKFQAFQYSGKRGANVKVESYFFRDAPYKIIVIVRVSLAIFKDYYKHILTSGFLKGPLKMTSASEPCPFGWAAEWDSGNPA